MHVAAVLSVAGAIGFRLLVAPYRLVAVTVPALAVAVLSGGVWLVLQAGELGGVDTFTAIVPVLPAVALHTWFGHVLLARIPLLVLAVALAGSGTGSPARLGGGLACAALAVLLQAATGHAAAIRDPVLLAALGLHLLAAAAWLGGLVPLWLALPSATSSGQVARRFSILGVIAVAVILGSGLEQGAILIGGLPGLIGTPYGRVAMLKILLLFGLLVLAAINRFRLTPALDRSPAALRVLRISLALEVGLGLCVVCAAAALGSLPPAVHEQPEWPLAWRPSLEAASDPDLRREILGAAGALAAAAVVLIASLVLRRLRLLAGLVAAVVACFALPHLSLLSVPAYPTSFYTSLTDFDAYGIVRGARLYGRNCAACHGDEGRGDGPLAHGLDIPPADLTAAHLWQHSDGDMFWFLTHGIDSPRGGLSMPGFAATLPTEARWALIDFLRARNAGNARRETGSWTTPVQAPAIDAPCGDGHVVSLEELRGQVVRVVDGPPDGDRALPSIFLSPKPPSGADCVAGPPELRQAYAIVAGLPPEALAGSVFLIDPGGWLRTLIAPGDPPPDLRRLARDITDHPIAPPSGIGHRH